MARAESFFRKKKIIIIMISTKILYILYPAFIQYRKFLRCRKTGLLNISVGESKPRVLHGTRSPVIQR